MADVTSAGSGAAGLGTLAARWAILAVWALGLLSGAIQGGFAQWDPMDVAAYVVALPGAILLTTPGDRILDSIRALGVVASALATAVLLFAGEPTISQTWLFSFSSYITALLIARGNVIQGGAGGGVLVLLGAAWAWSQGWAIGAVVEFVTIPVIAQLIGATWRFVLGRIVASERRHRSAQAQAVLAAELADEAAATDRRELAEVLREAGPLLRDLADGRELDDSLMSELALAEASIRDRVRAPWALSPILTETIGRRRRAGVDVLLLGESDGPIDERLAAAAARIVGSVDEGSVTIHAVPPGRGPALSILHSDGPETVRVLLAADGSILHRR